MVIYCMDFEYIIVCGREMPKGKEQILQKFKEQLSYAAKSPKTYQLETDLTSGRNDWNILGESPLRATVSDAVDLIKEIYGDLNEINIFDVGCGGGGLSIALASNGANVYGCDPSPVINFAYLKRDVALKANSTYEYVDALTDKIWSPMGTAKVEDEVKAIQELPLRKVPMFIQSTFQDITHYLGNEVPTPDLITCIDVLKTMDASTIQKFLHEFKDNIKPEGRMLIMNDGLDYVSDAIESSGLVIHKKGTLDGYHKYYVLS